jgi:RecA/RadA recombinase
MINVLFSGRMDGGIASGTTIFAAPSKHFKTAFLLLCIRAFQDKYPEGVAVFLDSEFGSPPAYFESFGIDMDRVAHIPIKDIEELKFEMMRQLNTLDEDTHVIFAIDSLGNLASKKEIDDAIEGESITDMTRAKSLKSFFRMVTPHLKIKNIPMIVSQHVYKEQSKYAPEILAGGRGQEYSADNIYFISRAQDKNDKTKEIDGWEFKVIVKKSRFVKESSTMTLEVSYGEGINSWSGLLEIAIESGHVDNSSQGWYIKKGEDKKYRKDDTNTKQFWESILQDETFQEFVTDKYLLKPGSILQDLSKEEPDEENATEHVESDVNENETNATFEDLKPKKKRAK